jgi:hypothetical protein
MLLQELSEVLAQRALQVRIDIAAAFPHQLGTKFVNRPAFRRQMESALHGPCHYSNSSEASRSLLLLMP